MFWIPKKDIVFHRRCHRVAGLDVRVREGVREGEGVGRERGQRGEGGQSDIFIEEGNPAQFSVNSFALSGT